MVTAPFYIEQRSQDGLCIGHFQAMASPCELLIDSRDRQLAQRLTMLAVAEVGRIEQKYSRYRTDNCLYAINHAQGQTVAIDTETARLFEFADLCYRLSDGMFDISSGILRKLWPMCGTQVLPTPLLIEEQLQYIGWDSVKRDSATMQLPTGMELDLGGIGKEYAVDYTLQQLQQQSDVPMLLNLGGDLAVTGQRSDGNSWHIGIEQPDNATADNAAALATIANGAIATSGNTKRFVEINGQRYGHILNPKTGYPVVDAPLSVTVAAQSATMAGMLATFAMLQGKAAELFLEQQQHGIVFGSFSVPGT